MNTAVHASQASQTESLDSLYDRALLWRGRLSRPAASSLTTGFHDLDTALHGSGWPASGLVELLCTQPCPQALRLMLPALSGLQDGLIALANPPARPQSSTLRQAGIHSANLLVMRSDKPDTLLRACRESAASGAISALVLWIPAGADTPSNLRRLHLAAQQGRCLLVVMRSAEQAQHASPAPLRLQLTALPPTQMRVDIIKQPGGWGGQRLNLDLLPRNIHQPLAATVDMPAPSANPKSTFKDPDSRFRLRSPRQPNMPAAALNKAPTQNLSLPL